MIAVAFHASLDGEQVAEMIQWESSEHLQSALKAADIDEHIGDVRQATTGDEFLPCTPRYVYTARQAADATPAVSPVADAFTVIVRLETDPGQQQALLDTLIKDVEALRETPQGLLSVSLLATQDGKNVVEYWQFENQAAYAALRPEFERSALANKFGPLIRASEVRLYETGPIMLGVGYKTETQGEVANVRTAGI